MHRCAHMGTHASGRSSRYDICVTLIASLASRSCRHIVPSLSLSAVNVHLPKDRISMAHQGFGFCEFLTEEDAEYACKIMNQIKLWGKPIRVNKVRNRPRYLFDTGLVTRGFWIRLNSIVSAESCRPLRTRSSSTWARISS